MIKQDFQSATQMLVTWRNSFDDYLKNDPNSKKNIVCEMDFGKEITAILNENKTNLTAKNLNLQYLKIIQIANDIRHLKLTNDDTLPDWLEEELELVFVKIKNLLASLEKELN